MDLKLHRPHGCCHISGRAFAPGEPFYSALVRSRSGPERIDCASECWQGPPDSTLAWWRSLYPSAQSGGPELAPVDVLLDVLEQLEQQPADAALRYLLALELLRRRVLRIVDQGGGAMPGVSADTLHLACRRRDVVYAVAVTPPAADAAGPLQDRLTSLLWSGGAA
ncbi:MAG: hypothetical protein EBR28_05240 [Planctomycetia bacterium]|nr:hypothetical protein [Planctomycetia bacterium]